MATNSNRSVKGKHAKHAAPSQSAVSTNAATNKMPAANTTVAMPSVNASGQGYAAANPTNYSRAAYGTASQHGNTPQPPKKKRGKRIAIIVVSVIVALLLIVGIAAFAYYQSIKSNLAYQGDLNELNEALTATDNKTEPFYVLVIGSDNWEDEGARSDCMLLTRIDLNTATVTMVSVPRDTPYTYNGETVKLNQIYAEEGEVACIKAVSEITGVPISHYVEIEFDQLQEVVDAMGGLTVDVPYAIDYEVYTYDAPVVHIDAGVQTLTGEQAVALARMRIDYDTIVDESGQEVSADSIRQANIRAMMTAMMKQILTGPVQDIPGSIQTLSKMVHTDIATEDLINWATTLANAAKVTVYSCTGPYKGDIDEDTGMWLTYEAPEQWKKLMAAVDAGKDPADVAAVGTTADGKVSTESTETITGNNSNSGNSATNQNQS